MKERLTQARAGKIVEAIRLQGLGDKVTAESFQGGILTWKPGSLFAGEVTIPHRLGRVPRGVVHLGGTTGFEFTVSPEQRSRWTRDTLVLTPQTYQKFVQVMGVKLSADTAVGVPLPFNVPYTTPRIFHQFSISSNNLALNAELTLKASMRKAGTPVTAPPYDDVQVSTLGATAAPHGADLSFVDTILVNPGQGDEYHFQVY